MPRRAFARRIAPIGSSRPSTRTAPAATPLQSLTLLNDGFIWDSAAALAEAATPKERDFAASCLVANPFRGLAQSLLSSNEFLYID